MDSAKLVLRLKSVSCLLCLDVIKENDDKREGLLARQPLSRRYCQRLDCNAHFSACGEPVLTTDPT